MISVSNLHKKYGNFLAIDNVSFNIGKGEVVGFLGPNGAGKSTIMNILTGYLSLTDGKVLIDGLDIIENPEEAKKRIGYLPEIPPLYTDMTVKEYLYFVYDLKKVRFPKTAHIGEIMRLVNLSDVENRLIKNLSKGYRQRVGFAGALVGNPEILILDEPTVGLDPKQIFEIRALIEKLGTNHTIILSSHILSEIQAVCKRVIIINKGKVLEDDNIENLTHKLSENNALNVTAFGDADLITKALKELDSVKNVTYCASGTSGAFDYTIEPEKDESRREISSVITKNGGEIVAFNGNTITLEQAFLRLTSENFAESEE